MSDLAQLINAENTRCACNAPSRKRALQTLSELAAHAQNNADLLFDQLMDRERLGNTGLGEGIAIPHCRAQCEQMSAAFITLDRPIDYEAADGEPVDLLFALIVPEQEQHAHLAALAELAAVFGKAEVTAKLRACDSDADLLNTMQTALMNNSPGAVTA